MIRILLVTDTTGAVVERIDYDEFGNVLSDSNPGFQPLGFAAGLHDMNTALVRFGARDYDSLVGRWTVRDPLRFGSGTTNLYGYSMLNPIMFSDPSGLAVYICKRVADLPGNSVFGFTHQWIVTGGGAAGMGACGQGVPGHGQSDSPYSTQTCINDHSNEDMNGPGVQCELIEDVDENCVNAEILKSRAGAVVGVESVPDLRSRRSREVPTPSEHVLAVGAFCARDCPWPISHDERSYGWVLSS